MMNTVINIALMLIVVIGVIAGVAFFIKDAYREGKK